MNYVFEATVRYLFRRVTRRARPAITLITEKEMQQAIAANCSTLDLTLQPLHLRDHQSRPFGSVITVRWGQFKTHNRHGVSANGAKSDRHNDTPPPHRWRHFEPSPWANSGCHSHRFQHPATPRNLSKILPAFVDLLPQKTR